MFFKLVYMILIYKKNKDMSNFWFKNHYLTRPILPFIAKIAYFEKCVTISFPNKFMQIMKVISLFIHSLLLQKSKT